MKNHGSTLDDFSLEIASTTDRTCLKESFNELQKKYETSRFCEKCLHDVNTPLLNLLHEAEITATSTEEQLATFRHTVTDLLDIRLEGSNKNHEGILQRLTDCDIRNNQLQKKIFEKEKRIQELSDLYQKEKSHSYKAVQLTKAIEATKERLHGQLQSKEEENTGLVLQVQNLERKIQDHKLETECLKHQIHASKVKAEQDKAALKKATRAQKQRAERFGMAAEKLQLQIKDKEAKITETLYEAETSKKHHSEVADETSSLKTLIMTLKTQVTSLIGELQKTKNDAVTSREELLQKIHNINSENGFLLIENERLKASLTGLEDRTASCEVEIKELTLQEKQQKELAGEYKTQVQDLLRKTERTKDTIEKLLKENTLASEGRELEIEKVKSQMEARLKELERFPDRVKAAEHRLQECQQNLLHCKERCTDQSKTISQLQAKDSNEHSLLEMSLISRVALEEENSHLQTKYEALNRKMDEINVQNQQLVEQLSEQEKILHDSEARLQEKSKDVLALTRQLEAALDDIRKKVTDMKEKTSSDEHVLQRKISKLETELRQKEKELKQLCQKKKNVTKHNEQLLKDLQLSLEQSESQTQSIQNYIHFLKTSYATMFGESI
ncbi:protein BCAP isoform X2 [Protopterus annectens]|uniref:protein BCAP isoform X2 n=1 Tax=Protopterus annectens TaxID=7888 RepID=UPI001CF9A040|nr:protein BCAP isoform X2 [Protopterus annectens]